MMIEDELIKIWQSSPNQEQLKFSKSRLMLDVQSGMDRIHRKIYWRDLREAMFAVIGMGGFIYGLFFVNLPLLSKIASVLICIWGVYTVVLVRRARKHEPDKLTSAYLDYLRNTKAYLDIQITLLERALYWFILPAIFLVSLFLAGFWGIPEKLPIIIQAEATCIGLCVLIYLLHKAAVSTELGPKRKKIEELLRMMEG